MNRLKINKQSIKNFFSDHTMSAAVDNVLAMFPSTILMPLMINATVGFEVFNISLVLFVSGFATLLYLIITQGRLPGYLGSSFAFIGVSIYIAALIEGGTQEEITGYVIGAFICSGGFLLILSLLCKIGKNNSNEKVMRVINKIIPTAVMGPAISLIGLELSGQAVTQAGLYNGFNMDTVLALITILLIIILSVTRRKFFKKSSIFLGVILAGIIAIAMNRWDFMTVINAPIFQAPKFRFVLPRFSLRIAIMVFPPTLILFSEHIGRKIMIEELQDSFFKDKLITVKPEKISLFRSLLGNSVANLFSAGLCGVPLTLYGENLAVMRINNDVRPNQFYVCSIVVVILSFSGNLLMLIESIPDPILGGLSLVLMGIIAAPGIKMLVDDKVDYSKITNLFLTASVLIVGLSDMVISVFGTEFKGMSLGLIVGIILNALFKFFGLLKISKEHLGFDEIKSFCETLYEDGRKVNLRSFDNGTEIEFYVSESCLPEDKFIGISNDFDELRITIRTDEKDDDCLMKFNHKQIGGWLALEVDGTFSDKTIMDLIKKSFALTLNPPEGLLFMTEDKESEEAQGETAEAGQAVLQQEAGQAVQQEEPEQTVQNEEPAKTSEQDGNVE